MEPAVLGQEVPGFLLGVASRFANGQVLDRRERAGVGQGQADGGLDQRADIAGQHLFGVRDGSGRPAAERDRDRPEGQHDLLGDIDAERADELVAGGAPLDDLADPPAVGAADDPVEVGHPGRTVLLGQDRLAEAPLHGIEDAMVELDVEAEIPQKLIGMVHIAPLHDGAMAPPLVVIGKLTPAAGPARRGIHYKRLSGRGQTYTF